MQTKFFCHFDPKTKNSENLLLFVWKMHLLMQYRLMFLICFFAHCILGMATDICIESTLNDFVRLHYTL